MSGYIGYAIGSVIEDADTSRCVAEGVAFDTDISNEVIGDAYDHVMEVVA
ncbi:hypothetical protein Enr17x_15030 [Gimesia fumaroli]|uniref:Uncharacterized protein n=1 Tax=Gimesia fumaroli TaxID=2527976 RepID=A0A518I8Q2_9PLAN|nr:hypothetical protein Enr17x_15030 [Gimesia fumaroli]